MENPMIDNKSEYHYLKGFTAGLLLGSLAGAVTILLVAPQSGEKTRTKILKQSKMLRHQTVSTVENALTQVRTKANQITADVRDKADELQHLGQDVIDEQKERLSAAVDSGNTVVQEFLD